MAKSTCLVNNNGASKSNNSFVQLLNDMSIGSFKAVIVSAKSDELLACLLKDYPHVLSIVPDTELIFDLPKPQHTLVEATARDHM